ncbi:MULTISPECIES: O-antigen ligase [unclassified Lentimicrobium]|uniref:O-antigen ligase family protein n=1 Tax=unclassified Lentimicrobium TaxID=2677434 RepID=UPI0015517F6A|nr:MULTISPECIES: O-antigen ligase family protein [unclassified Lentimicrobium]NPD47876.1 O-antigen ligase family protein [Lentimicrobium sp. S6]NPD83541.1 O-antigen ligase family protein [Lentimicrobium sp. L6]NPD85970.1 O-antigen ligase family protein [Lentimicrobium sp. L6]
MGFQKGLISDTLYEKLLFWALALMVVSIPSSRVLMSMSQMAFGVLWLAHGQYRKKWSAFINNRVAVLMVSLFVIHFIGVFYSTDIDYALKDLRTKVPILIIPFMFSAFPKINSEKLYTLLKLFIGSVIMISLYVFVEHYNSQEVIRDLISREVFSHIRFSLNLNLALFFIVILLWKQKLGFMGKISAIVVFGWLFFFLLKLEAFTGIVVFAVLLLGMFMFVAIKVKKIIIKILLWSIVFFLPLFIGFYLLDFYEKNTKLEELDIENLDKWSPSGHYYYHRLDLGTENGKYVYAYIQEKELREEWNSRSEIKYDSLDSRGQMIKYTLIRYLTSIDQRKDKEGVMSLTKEDVANVENGIANVNYTKGFGIDARLMKILLEYNNYIRTGDPSGHSVMQRIEYWKTASYIIRNNFWIGVGTGDMNIAFQDKYDSVDSKLDLKWRLRTHNQYLSIWVGLGVLGFLWFIFVLIYPVLYLKAYKDLFFMVFFITLLVSMLTEDTIETQAGLSFYVFFYCLFLIIVPHENIQNKIVSNDQNR